jgi:uncharacterized protein YjbI with pentapeptide repeats
MSAAARTPSVPELPSEPEPLAGVTGLDHHQTLEGVLLRDADLSGQRAGGVSVTASVLQAVELPESSLEQLSLSDVELSGCNLSNVTAPRARWHRVHARGCRMTGMLISGAVLSDVTFTDCRIDLASFGSSRLERVTFAGCRLAQTDFMGSQLQDVRFEQSDLTEEDFRGATLRRCEARGCELSSIQGADRLRGLSMPWPEIVAHAGVWATALGIAELED